MVYWKFRKIYSGAQVQIKATLCKYQKNQFCVGKHNWKLQVQPKTKMMQFSDWPKNCFFSSAILQWFLWHITVCNWKVDLCDSLHQFLEIYLLFYYWFGCMNSLRIFWKRNLQWNEPFTNIQLLTSKRTWLIYSDTFFCYPDIFST